MDDDPLILSALNDYLYCPRRCALHRLEGIWTDNAHTVRGALAHRTADHPGYRAYEESAQAATPTPPGAPGAPATLVRVERAVPLFSRRHNLIGKADIVEFRRAAGGEALVPLPVDYKLGPRRKWDNDDVQLCAQALCLEDMLGLPEGGVQCGAVYHVRTRRRRPVEFTPALRGLTLRTIDAVRALLASGIVPAAVLKPQCEGCSIRAVCVPELTVSARSLDAAHAALFGSAPVAVAEQESRRRG
ncbi:MAG: CRISPR-associated protein Cas4 [Phycisphaerales bacterium]|nr:CRISPR-associated protein Cas4 [Phycisphaerales bacterium]